MKYIIGQNRNQTVIFPVSLDKAINQDHEVRLIDLFVDSLDIAGMGFKTEFEENGRPAYHPKDLLKLYIYGYLYRVRSSRELEKETKRNIEVMWLLKRLSPDHNTISNFRRDNPKAIKKVFRETVAVAKNFELIEGKLSEADQDKRELIKQEIEKHQARKQGYQELQKQLEETGEKQISTSDPQSRQMITRNNITEVAYNVQTTVDAENNIPIDYKVTNENDSKAMGNMLQRAKSILRTNEFTGLYDKGYHTGSEFKIADDLEIDVMVAIPTVAANAPNHEYNVEHFEYNTQADHYICPQGKVLSTTGKWHKAKTYQFKRYTTKDCMQCPVKEECSKATYGKGVQRSEYQAYINHNKERIEKNKDYYRRRQAIIEHPYGTIKRQWGFSYILTKKYKERAEADVGLMFTAYNLRRIISILGIDLLITYLKVLYLNIIAIFAVLKLQTSKFEHPNFSQCLNLHFSKAPSKKLIFGRVLSPNGGF